MKFQAHRKNRSITVAIILTVVLIAISTALTFYGKYQSKLFNKVKEEVADANSKIGSTFTHIFEMDKSVRGFLVFPDEKFLGSYYYAGDLFVTDFDSLEVILNQQSFAETDKFQAAKRAISGYYNTLGEIITLTKQKENEQALAIYREDRGTQVWFICNEFVVAAKAHQQQIYDRAEGNYETLLTLISAVQASAFIIGIPTLFFVLIRINKSERLRLQLFMDLLESRKTYLFNDQAEHRTYDERSIIQHITDDLKSAATFILGISRNDYSVNWKDMDSKNLQGNDHTLAGALVHMREEMKEIKRQDKQRLWTTEGTSKVSEIIRDKQGDQPALTSQLLSYIVNYTNANQGGLFLSEEDDTGNVYLALAACYAYDKKKHIEKTIRVGQGLIGQVYLENKTTYLTKVPDQYVNITSGLGESTPSTLILIPLTHDETIAGVLELASFDPFEEGQISFLEDIGKIVGSAIVNERRNSRTQQMLAHTQESAKELQAQEEEVRQNMEELQATQEEMQRKSQEYEAVIEQQQSKIYQLENGERT